VSSWISIIKQSRPALTSIHFVLCFFFFFFFFHALLLLPLLLLLLLLLLLPLVLLVLLLLLVCMGDISPEKDREYQLNEKYVLTLHTAKHIEDRIREQDEFNGTDFASHFIAKKRPESPTRDLETATSGTATSSSSAPSGSDSKRPKPSPSSPSPQQVQMQKKFKIEMSSTHLSSDQQRVHLALSNSIHQPPQSQLPSALQSQPMSSSSSSSSTHLSFSAIPAEQSLQRPSIYEVPSPPRPGAIPPTDFESLSLPAAVAILEQNLGASEVDPYRNWVAAMAARLQSEPYNPNALSASRDLDTIAHALHTYQDWDEDNRGRMLQYLGSRAADESKTHREIGNRHKAQNPVFKDAVHFDRIFDEYYREAKEIVERAAETRRRKRVHDESATGDEIIEV